MAGSVLNRSFLSLLKFKSLKTVVLPTQTELFIQINSPSIHLSVCFSVCHTSVCWLAEANDKLNVFLGTLVNLNFSCM